MKSLLSILVLFLAAACIQKVQANRGPSEQCEQPRLQRRAKTTVTKDKAIAIARGDAEKVYGDLTPYEMAVTEEKRAWRIDFELKDKTANGGGPHYRIDKGRGKIVWKKYEQ